jgi:protein tyrosine/serine phosphatase
MRIGIRLTWAALWFVALLASPRTGDSEDSNVTMQVHWAVRIEKPGLPNFHQVTPALYRGAQPTEEGIGELKKLGVRTIVNLRAFHSDHDRVGNTGLAYEHIDFKTWHAEEEDVVRFLKIVTNTNRTPVFVHCEHGADRTGMMCAIYRVAVCGWTKDQAIQEMTQGDFGFHKTWQNLIRFIRDLDIEKLNRQVGIATANQVPK